MTDETNPKAGTLFDHKNDTFQGYKVTPQLSQNSSGKNASKPSVTKNASDITAERRILQKQAAATEALVRETCAQSQTKMTRMFGMPTYLSSYQQIQPVTLAVVATGALGSGEMRADNSAKVTLVFSHDGETNGANRISNADFFNKVAAELPRNSNVTVTGIFSVASFLSHHMNQAGNVERLILPSARVIVMPDDFDAPLAAHIADLAYQRPLPTDFFTQNFCVHDAVSEIEFTLRRLQLENQKVFPDLRQHSLFDLLDVLQKHNLVSDMENTIYLQRIHDAS